MSRFTKLKRFVKLTCSCDVWYFGNIYLQDDKLMDTVTTVIFFFFLSPRRLHKLTFIQPKIGIHILKTRYGSCLFININLFLLSLSNSTSEKRNNKTSSGLNLLIPYIRNAFKQREENLQVNCENITLQTVWTKYWVSERKQLISVF